MLDDTAAVTSLTDLCKDTEDTAQRLLNHYVKVQGLTISQVRAHLRLTHMYHIQWSAVITWSIFSKSLTKTPHSSPIRARYGVSFVNSKSDLCFIVVITFFNVVSWYIGPHYNGTRLYTVYRGICTKLWQKMENTYHEVSNIRRTESPKKSVSHLSLQLSLCNI